MPNPHCRFAAFYACLIPKPTSFFQSSGAFTISSHTKILSQKDSHEVNPIANLLAAYLQEVSGDKALVNDDSADQRTGNIQLTLNGDPGLGEEGYELSITTDSILVRAVCPAGLFYGVQTLRQLLPAHPSATVSLPAVSIRDTPRFEWRGAMLDVARHFFGVEDVKRYIDLISHYKMNRLHLHLTDDQGWRIEIKSWPRLTEFGGRTQVGGSRGGYYTQQQ